MKRSSVLAILPVVALAACDEKAAQESRVEGKWENVCTQSFFYNAFASGDAGGTVRCVKWERRCIGMDGKPSDGCSGA